MISLLVTLVVLCLVFGLLYWIITLVGNILPPPIRNIATTLMLVLLALIAIWCLLDLTGLLGPRHISIPLK